MSIDECPECGAFVPRVDADELFEGSAFECVKGHELFVVIGEPPKGKPAKARLEYRSSWEPLDADGVHFFGVFQADGDTPDPMAIFPSIVDAHEWIEWMRTRKDEDKRIGPADHCVMAIRGLAGECWNHYETPPGACTHEVEDENKGRMECGQVASGSYGKEPRCRTHAQPEPE